MTGLNLKALEVLQSSFAQALAEATIPRRSQQPRERSVGGAQASTRERRRQAYLHPVLLQVLSDFDLAGLLFDLDRSQANRWMHRLQTLLEDALGQQLVLPTQKLRSISEVVEAFSGVERVIIDATKQPVQGAKDNDKQRELLGQAAAAHPFSPGAGRPKAQAPGRQPCLCWRPQR